MQTLIKHLLPVRSLELSTSCLYEDSEDHVLCLLKRQAFLGVLILLHLKNSVEQCLCLALAYFLD